VGVAIAGVRAMKIAIAKADAGLVVDVIASLICSANLFS
jgi:hypothetical protein